MITEYELYSDERYYHPSGKRYTMIGGIISTAKGRERMVNRLIQVRKKFNLTSEMRWGRVSNSHIDGYKNWLHVFFEDHHANFSLLIIDTSDSAWNKFRPRPDRKPSKDDKLASA
jgi:hypothetical protein